LAAMIAKAVLRSHFTHFL